MRKLLSFFYKYKREVYIGVFAIFFVIILFSALTNYIKNKNATTLKNETEELEYENELLSTDFSTSYIDESSLTSGLNGDSESVEELFDVTVIIDSFINYCNEKKYSKAYNMLTDECKEVLYNDQSEFEEYYLSDVFSSPKKAYIEYWINNTYKVTLQNDIMASGDSSDTGVVDYITVVEKDGVYELNIFGYVGREQLGITQTKNSATINVIYRDVYIDYEEYNITVKNSTSSNIAIDNLDSTKALYVEDKNKIKYYWNSSEFSTTMVTVNCGESKNFDIKFYKTYSSTRTTKYIYFSEFVFSTDDKKIDTFKINLK